MELLAEIGGLGGGIFGIMAFFCTEVTYMLIINKFIKLFYTNNEGEIYNIESDRLIPLDDEIDREKTIGK